MFSRLSRLPLRSSQRRLYKPFAGVAAVSGGLLLAAGYVHADSFEGKETTQSLGSLIRSYTVYTMCSIPPLVDYSPQILEVLTNVPGVRQVTEAIVRATFFNQVSSPYLGTVFPDLNLLTIQFVGGDTAEGTLPVLRSFRRGNKGALLSYSVEVDPATAASHNAGTLSTDDLPHKRIIKEMIHSIDVAADFEDSLNDGGRRTWVAVKLVSPKHILFCRRKHVTFVTTIRPLSCRMLRLSFICLNTSSNPISVLRTRFRSLAVHDPQI